MTSEEAKSTAAEAEAAAAEAAAHALSKEEQDEELRMELDRERRHIDDKTRRYKTGGLHFFDERMIRFQRQIVWEAVKEIGWNIASGKSLNVINVSLPVRIFEARSFLQRLAVSWSYAPTLLKDASEQQDPLERFKRVIAFAVAGLHLNVRQRKPFNPILGETLQATMKDGSQVFMEQTSHHPPVSHFQVFGANNLYKMYGFAEMKAAMSANAMKGNQVGPNVIEFADKAKVTFSLPDLWIKGVLWGDRVAEYFGHMYFTDENNKLSCTLKFNPDGVGYLKSWFVSASTPSDRFVGDILQDGRKVCSVSGSWIDRILFDGQEFLKFGEYIGGEHLFKVQNSLPSDAVRRIDLLALAAGKYDDASACKFELEQLQRHDRAMRKRGHEERAQHMN